MSRSGEGRSPRGRRCGRKKNQELGAKVLVHVLPSQPSAWPCVCGRSRYRPQYMPKSPSSPVSEGELEVRGSAAGSRPAWSGASLLHVPWPPRCRRALGITSITSGPRSLHLQSERAGQKRSKVFQLRTAITASPAGKVTLQSLRIVMHLREQGPRKLGHRHPTGCTRHISCR